MGQQGETIETLEPAVFVNRRGKGKTVLVPCSPDAALMSNYRIPENRLLIRNVIRFLNPDPRVKVRAPANVEIVLVHDEARGRLILHLLCFSAPPTATAAAFPKGKLVLPPIMEEPMTYEAQIQVTGQFSKVEALGPGSRVSVRGDRIVLGTSAIHEALIIYL